MGSEMCIRDRSLADFRVIESKVTLTEVTESKGASEIENETTGSTAGVGVGMGVMSGVSLEPLLEPPQADNAQQIRQTSTVLKLFINIPNN